MADPRCLSDGLLVGMDFPVPDDPREYYRVRDEVVGCNRLRCGACGAEVRRLDGFALDRRPQGDAALLSLYQTTDPRASPFLTRDLQGDRMRVYTCRCSAETVGGVVRLSMGDRPIEWSCAGHPQS